jgi:hypothetical protein
MMLHPKLSTSNAASLVKFSPLWMHFTNLIRTVRLTDSHNNVLLLISNIRGRSSDVSSSE